MASKGGGDTRGICGLQSDDGRVSTETSKSKSTEQVEDVEDAHVEILAGGEAGEEETADKATETRVIADNLSILGLVTFTLLEGKLLGPVYNGEERREGVGEVQDTESGNHRCQTREVRNGSGNDKSNGPVDRDENNPGNFTALGGERREAEELDKDAVVQDLDTNVTVQSCSNDGRQEGKNITSSLDAV